MTNAIRAGLTSEINKDSGQWLIVDIGFSSSEPTCGVCKDTEEPKVVTFSKLVELVTHEAQKKNLPILNLLIEAPLSVAFQEYGNGNPTRRICDSWGVGKDARHRDFYVNAGASTLIAALYLLRNLDSCDRKRDVRLFEGLVSFKTSKTSSDEGKKGKTKKLKEHKRDVLNLRNAVWAGGNEEKLANANAEIFGKEDLPRNGTDRIESPFPFLDKCLIPPVIRIKPDP